MSCYLFDKEYGFARILSGLIVCAAECPGEFRINIISFQVFYTFLRNISDRLDIPKYSGRVTVTGKRVYGECRVDKCI